MSKTISLDWASINLSDRKVEEAVKGDMLIRAASNDTDTQSTYTLFIYDENDTVLSSIIKEDADDNSVTWYILANFVGGSWR